MSIQFTHVSERLNMTILAWCCTLFLLCSFATMLQGVVNDVTPTCDSEIYCQGELLHVVQTSGIYQDSKTFVDMTMLQDPAVISDDFAQLLAEHNGTLTKEQVMSFVGANFKSDAELDPWVPHDFKPFPSFLERVKDQEIRTFAWNVIAIWPKLTRKVKPSVLEHPARHSIIYAPQGIVIPGGRFRESYYWDTYWIIKGLLVSEMHETARGLLDNFVHWIKLYGFIPNGGRVYYTRRSQPPLFTAMCMEYFKATGNLSWVRSNIEFIEREVLFWRKQMINVGKHSLARYLPVSCGPRSESYREDYEVAARFPEHERCRVYEDLKGGAESGWDFSSRWIYGNNLTYINTKRTLPVDLNAYLGKAYHNLAHFYSLLGMRTKQAHWHDEFAKMKTAIFNVFWNETDGTWYDFDLKEYRHKVGFYPSNLAPLWASIEHDESVHDLVYDYLHENGVFDYLGGTPASTQHTGEQWDYPNAWAPLQDVVISALSRGGQRSQEMAVRLAHLWVSANAIGFRQAGQLFEKYDALVPGKYGGGGEYTVQAGFGWTNGLVLDLIQKYFT